MYSLNIPNLVIFLLIFIVTQNETKDLKDLSRGFGTNIKWLTIDDALKTAIKESKPMMIIIHKSWCGACANLKSKLSVSEKFRELSENFLMINLEDDEEPADPKFAPDGNYIPRIFFIDPNGNLRYDLYNQNGNPNYKYFYSTDNQVTDVMNRANNLFRHETRQARRKSNSKRLNNKTKKDL